VVGGQTYSYDANGNLLSGGGRSYVWNAENQPTSITSGGVTETYQYDADGNRATRTRAGVTTTYAWGAWEQVGTNAKKLYQFNGRVVAQRDGTTNAVIWIHPDHLGGSFITTTGSAAISESLVYNPWGQTISAGITQTSLNFTGQRLDGTGLLYYNARYYDANLGRFISADTIVPGAGSLTVSPNDPVAAGAWSQRSGGPTNPQQLNRYSYVLNNPVNRIDPSGHCLGPVLVWCAVVVGEFVADVVVPAVVGTFLIAGAAEAGQQLGQAHAAAEPANPDPQPDIHAQPDTLPTDQAERRGPNPHGSRGGPAHRGTIDRRIGELENEGYEHIGGGDLPEEYIRLANGRGRRPDITMRNPDGSRYRENVGRTTQRGQPVARERRALDDLEQATGTRPSFTPYDRRRPQ
jgi:RHS repeat-associated protein